MPISPEEFLELISKDANKIYKHEYSVSDNDTKPNQWAMLTQNQTNGTEKFLARPAYCVTLRTT